MEIPHSVFQVNLRISRNAPCPCGSGRRFKRCHGTTASDERPIAGWTSDADDQDLAEALSLHESGEIDDAEAIYRRLLDHELENSTALHYLGVIHYQREDYQAAEQCIRRALSRDPVIPMAHNNLGLVLRALGKLEEALESYGQELARDMDSPIAHNNCGVILCDLGRYSESIASLGKAIALKPDFAEAHANLGRALLMTSQFEESLLSINRALSLDPGLRHISANWLCSMMHCCDWGLLEAASAGALSAVTKGEAILPGPLLSIHSSPAQQQRCARTYVHDTYPVITSSVSDGRLQDHDRIRIGYLSADFHGHATAHLLAKLFESHDRSRFEIIGISFGPSIKDAWRERLEKSFDRFFDVAEQSDRQIAGLARDLEIDIAVDLKGHTNDARLGVFSHRAAPLQVSYLGYPGTVGAEYMDYIIADRILIPQQHRQYYDEKIVYLPNSYQANDSSKEIADRQFTRAELGLPEDAFVFCCFNNNYKITPELFDIWMRLLHQVDRSVFWLFEGNGSAVRNLRKEAVRRGIDPARMIFAPRMGLPEHLARHRQADLFLDTFYCNAHTTASDSLWAGLPLVTRLGDSFAGRVASSLLSAVGLPELITHSDVEYEELAMTLASEPERLRAIRQKLARNRTTQSLFDSTLTTRHLEAGYQMMLARSRRGLPPDHLFVGNPDLY